VEREKKKTIKKERERD